MSHQPIAVQVEGQPVERHDRGPPHDLVRQRHAAAREHLAQRAAQPRVLLACTFVQAAQGDLRGGRVQERGAVVLLRADVRQRPDQVVREPVFASHLVFAAANAEERSEQRKFRAPSRSQVTVDVPPLQARRGVRQVVDGQVDRPRPRPVRAEARRRREVFADRFDHGIGPGREMFNHVLPLLASTRFRQHRRAYAAPRAAWFKEGEDTRCRGEDAHVIVPRRRLPVAGRRQDRLHRGLDFVRAVDQAAEAPARVPRGGSRRSHVSSSYAHGSRIFGLPRRPDTCSPPRWCPARRR